jgi:ubiquinol-cytochrome c reductase cytochrome b subunit
MGVVAIAITFASLIAMPFLSTTHIGSPKFRVLSERLYWLFVADLALLTWVGQKEILDATIVLGQVCTVILFIYLVLAYPFLSWLESYLYLNSIKNMTPSGHKVNK